MKLLNVSTLLLLFASSSLSVEPYPWIPGNRPVSEPVYPEILMDAAEAIAAVAKGDLLPIDLRGIDDFSAGHIPGAVWKQITEPNPSQALLLYADDFEAIGSSFLLLDGDPAPRILRGGVEAWRAAGGLLVAGDPKRNRKAGLIDESVKQYVEWAEVYEAFAREEFEIIDLRGRDAWMSYEDVDGLRAGHIPHSLPYDFTDLLLGRRWPDPAAARAKFLKLGPREGDQVNSNATFILYGHDPADSRLGLAYLLLRLMDVDTRVYLGGWTDWANSADSPVVRILPTEKLEGMLRPENPNLSDQVSYETLVLLDLRGNLDFNRRHLPGSLSLPIHLFRDSLSTLGDEHWRDEDRGKLPLVLYCYGPDCIRSRNGASMAARQGFHNLLWYRDGVEGWRRADLPLYK